MSNSMSNQKPLVSIAMATYNGEKFLRKQLDSLLSQIYKNIEVVVSDDCSTDETIAILNEYKDKFKMRLYFNKSNLGFLKNFETAVSLCKGDYIVLADQDDIWMPEKVSTLLDEIGDYSLIYSDASLINEHDDILPGSLIKNSGIKPVTGKAFTYFVCNSCVTGCTSMFKKELVPVILPIPENETSHDWWFSVVASRQGGVKYLNRELIQYRQHDYNVIGAKEKICFFSRLMSYIRNESYQPKMDYYHFLEKRARCYLVLSEKLRLTESEVTYLKDIKTYASSLIDPLFNFNSFLLSWKHRNSLFPSSNIVEKYIFVFSKLINKIGRSRHLKPF